MCGRVAAPRRGVTSPLGRPGRPPTGGSNGGLPAPPPPPPPVASCVSSPNVCSSTVNQPSYPRSVESPLGSAVQQQVVVSRDAVAGNARVVREGRDHGRSRRRRVARQRDEGVVD